MLVIRSMVVGGAERQCRDLAIALRARGHEVLLCTLGDGGPMAEGLSASGVEHVGLGHRGPRHVPRTMWRLRRLCRRFRPDVVYSFLSVANLIAAWSLPRRLRRRLVWGVRASWMDLPAYGALPRVVLRIERFFARLPARIIANSEAGVAHHVAVGFPADRMVCVENSIDLGQFHYQPRLREVLRGRRGVSEQQRVIVLVARIDPIKGHDCFIHAAARVAALKPEAEFWCVGGGDEALRTRLVEETRRLGIADRVHWIDETKDIPAIYSAADVAISASLSEGFPNVVAEALACGLPVVGTDAGDTGRIIGRSGRTVARNDAAGMAGAILDVLGEETFPRDRVRADFIGRFDPVLLLERHERTLLSVCAGEASCG